MVRLYEKYVYGLIEMMYFSFPSDVMEQTYEGIVRKIRSRGILGESMSVIPLLFIYLFYLAEDWMPGDSIPQCGNQKLPATLWEYKFGVDSEEILGPFPIDQILQWKSNVSIICFS